MSNFDPLSMLAPGGVLDDDRLAALDEHDILDTAPEAGFDDIVQLASISCDVPVALVSFVAGDRQWFKANVGFPHCQTDLDSSVCAHVLAEPDILVIPDLTADPRTRTNPLVTGDPHIRFYAGAPLRTRQGLILGSLCVIGNVARPGGLTLPQAEMLRTLARQVMTLLEMRRVIAGRDSHIARRRQVEERLGASAARLQISEAHWRGLFERLSEGFVIAELVRDEAGRAMDWRYLDVNPAWGELLGIDPATAIGRTVREMFPGIEEEWVTQFVEVVDTGTAVVFTRQVGILRRWYEGRGFPLDGDRFAVLFLEITGRVQADIRRNALLEIGDRLRDLPTVDEMTRQAAAIVGTALDVTRAGFGQLSADGEHVVVESDWTAPGMTSIAGRHRFADFGDITKELLLGEPLIVRDARTDPRTTADRRRWDEARIRALVNIPIQERGRTVAVLLVHHDEPRAWDEETVAFLRNVADRLAAALARAQAEERQELLNGELSHRMKNMLAMIQAIASQTLKGVTERDAVDGFQQRLLALSSAHDVLLRKSWIAAPMREVVDGALAQLAPRERFTVGGPDIMLGSRAALSTSLLLHELATNAAKHGALSSDAGRVVAVWRVDPVRDELVFTWNEVGGPPVAEPTHRGFGSRLIRSGLIGTGGVSLRYRPTGLEAEMRATLEQVQAS